MIRIEQGDITKLAVDAIVNAANQVMLGNAVEMSHDDHSRSMERHARIEDEAQIGSTK